MSAHTCPLLAPSPLPPPPIAPAPVASRPLFAPRSTASNGAATKQGGDPTAGGPLAGPAAGPVAGTAVGPVGTLTRSMVNALAQVGQWEQWVSLEPQLAGFGGLQEVLDARRRRDPRCYRLVAGLTALGSRRGHDDDDAALAVVVLLADGAGRVARNLQDVCEAADVCSTLWEAVKDAEPQLGSRAASYLLRRVNQQLTRPGAGMVSRLRRVPLDSCAGRTGRGEPHCGSVMTLDRDIRFAAPETADPAEDVADLLAWARTNGVIADADVDLLVELMAAEATGVPREEAQRVVGERHGVAMRTVRRRRDRTTAMLRAAAPDYLAAIA